MLSFDHRGLISERESSTYSEGFKLLNFWETFVLVSSTPKQEHKYMSVQTNSVSVVKHTLINFKDTDRISNSSQWQLQIYVWSLMYYTTHHGDRHTKTIMIICFSTIHHGIHVYLYFSNPISSYFTKSRYLRSWFKYSAVIRFDGTSLSRHNTIGLDTYLYHVYIINQLHMLPLVLPNDYKTSKLQCRFVGICVCAKMILVDCNHDMMTIAIHVRQHA